VICYGTLLQLIAAEIHACLEHASWISA
jgi:hypothetical protein